MMRDPINTLLSTARRVGDDFCWPAEQSAGVIDALSALSRAVLGVELWRIEDDEKPEVLGWSQYDIDTHRPWDEVVADGARRATDEVLGYSGDRGLWINITWVDPPVDESSDRQAGER
ncbi:MAG: hypothetical protein U0Q22_18965 [Acidimicrobiales bacterium]